MISLAPIISIANNTLFVKFYALHKNFQQDDEWNVPYIPNVQDIPNIPDNPAAGFSAVVPIFQPKKVDVCLILSRQKVEGYRLYCIAGKLTAAEEWKIYIYI